MLWWFLKDGVVQEIGLEPGSWRAIQARLKAETLKRLIVQVS